MTADPTPATGERTTSEAGAGLTLEEREAIGDWWDSSDFWGKSPLNPLYEIVERIVAAARADERERAARAVEAAAPPEVSDDEYATGEFDTGLEVGERIGMQHAARAIRQGDA